MEMHRSFSWWVGVVLPFDHANGGTTLKRNPELLTLTGIGGDNEPRKT